MKKEIILEKLDQKEALRYMGYDQSRLDEPVRTLMEQCEKELLSSIIPKYIFRIFDIENHIEGIKLTGTNMLLTGSSIKEHLDGCHKAVCLCVTISSEADKLIRKAQVQDMAKAFVLDSMASAAVEQVCAIAEEEIRGQYQKYYQTWRFGIGYGDLPLSLQSVFLTVLDAPKRIGVNVNKEHILIPRKSVTCIIGLSKDEMKKEKRGCQTCTLRESCAYRKRGDRCGI